MHDQMLVDEVSGLPGQGLHEGARPRVPGLRPDVRPRRPSSPTPSSSRSARSCPRVAARPAAGAWQCGRRPAMTTVGPAPSPPPRSPCSSAGRWPPARHRHPGPPRVRVRRRPRLPRAPRRRSGPSSGSNADGRRSARSAPTSGSPSRCGCGSRPSASTSRSSGWAWTPDGTIAAPRLAAGRVVRAAARGPASRARRCCSGTSTPRRARPCSTGSHACAAGDAVTGRAGRRHTSVTFRVAGRLQVAKSAFPADLLYAPTLSPVPAPGDLRRQVRQEDASLPRQHRRDRTARGGAVTRRRRAIGVLGALLVAALAVVAPASLPRGARRGRRSTSWPCSRWAAAPRGGRRGPPAAGRLRCPRTPPPSPSTALRCRPRSHRCSIRTLPWASSSTLPRPAQRPCPSAQRRRRVAAAAADVDTRSASSSTGRRRRSWRSGRRPRRPSTRSRR